MEMIFAGRGEIVNVPAVTVSNSSLRTGALEGAQRVLNAAATFYDHDILVVHMDADAVSLSERREFNFMPGERLVQRAKDGNSSVCARLVPLIPMRTMESWILADVETLLTKVLGADKTVSEMKLPKPMKRLPVSASEIEKYTQPKEALDYIVEHAFATPRKWRRSDIYDPMSELIRLERLRRLSSFRAFEGELKTALVQLGMISQE